jgi:formylglycine-generating enzyme required for sulfatase activity
MFKEIEMIADKNVANSFDDMVYIQASEYIYRVQHRIMEGDCQYDHGPRTVKVASFYIDKYPITNKRFKEFLDASKYYPIDDCNFLKHWENSTYPSELENHPVVWVSPTDAKAYAQWRGCRLPSDIEWQYAAGGDYKYKWPWGNKYNHKLCNSEGDTVTPVDRYPDGTSPFGCYDMCGNTWEWVDDLIDDGEHLFTFLRGGCVYKAPHFWHALGGPQPTNHHLKFPLLNEALNRCGTVGFRCVKDGAKDDK